MPRRRYVFFFALVAAGGIASIAWWKYTHAPLKISVRSVRTHSSPARADSSASTPAPDGRSDARVGTDSVDGAEIIADLDRKIHLTEQQREDLVRVLRQVATMQARIDRHENPSEREEMQRKLIRQLAVRLRLIVGEESSKGVTRALVKNKPRIVYK